MKRLFFLILPLIFLGCNATKSPTVSSSGTVNEVKPVQGDFSDLANRGICVNQGRDECYNYAQRAYKTGDHRTAIYAYDKVCARFQYLPACINMANMFEKGEGVKQNLSVAYDIYKRACYSGHSPSCQDMKRLSKYQGI